MKPAMLKKLLIGAGSFVILSGFTYYQVSKTIKEIRKSVIETLMVDSYYESAYYSKERHPDTTISFGKNEDGQSKKVLTVSSGLPSAYGLASSITDESIYFSPEFNSAFTKTFGKPIHGQHTTTKNKSKFLFYSAAGVQAAFNKLYIKPTEDFEGYKMKTIYNLSCKTNLRDFTKVMSHLMSKKAVFEQLCSNYLKEAKTDPEFHPSTFCEKNAKKLFTEADLQKMGSYSESASSYYFLGAIIRRQVDGTLPTLLSCLKTVLKDYDPEALKLVNGKF